MAVNIHFSLGARISASSLPIISATVDRGLRSTGNRCSCKLGSGLVKSGALLRAAVGGSGNKFAEQDGSLLGFASWNQPEVIMEILFWCLFSFGFVLEIWMESDVFMRVAIMCLS